MGLPSAVLSLGQQAKRVRGATYDAFIEQYLEVASSLFPLRCCTSRTSAPATPGGS